ncbi:MAG: pyridoxal phosphate-dependent aminotransferase family protein, partial [Desulfovibrio sp.]
MATIKHIKSILDRLYDLQDNNCYCYFKPISKSSGPEVEVDGQRFIMAGSNDYLGLTHDPRVMEAAVQAIERYGTGHGGTRFQQGNTTMLEELEARLAAFVGKKGALVHSTGFLTNLGAIGSLVSPGDVILCDRENHASIFEGCRSAMAKVVPFAHNDVQAAAKKIEFIRSKQPNARITLITEGVFSMSGDITILPELVALKKTYPDVTLYLDDAHGLGVLGSHGRGTAIHFDMVEDVDFIMGTFSKAMASIGGFIASDDEDLLVWLKHNSKTLIFSAALPACNAASVIKCLDILEEEPERVEKLWEIT